MAPEERRSGLAFHLEPAHDDVAAVSQQPTPEVRHGRGRRVLEFEAHSKVDWLIRGHGAGQLLIEATGRPQVWSSTRRGYSVQERTALDVLALSERYGIDAVITGPRGAREVASPAVAGEAAEPEISLW